MNYMESYTDAEEIRRLIPIYEKTEAHNMVSSLRERLEVLGESPLIEESPENEPEAVLAKKEYDSKALYEMKEAGMTWKEVTEATGVKTPWVKASIYRKENDLPKV